jgi:DNA-binding transcriptional MocR family regulator
VELRSLTDAGNSVFTQIAALHVFEHYDEVLAERRAILRERRDALAGALRELSPDWCYREPEGGLSFWVDLGARVSTRLAGAAVPRGVQILPGSRFGLDGTLDDHIRLPFVHPAPVAREGVRRLVEAYGDVVGPDASTETSGARMYKV